MSEFRQDPSSGDWVIISPGRATRPAFLEHKKPPRKPSPKSMCPFEDLKKSGNWPPIALYPRRADPSGKHWRIAVIPNKYPVLAHGTRCSVPFRYGMYHARTGVGRHELAVTRDHNKNFAALPPFGAKELFRVFCDRVRIAAADRCIIYTVPFLNWGPNAGATVWHPHYQIIAGPFIPVHSARSLAGAQAYFKAHRRCVRCDIIREVRAEKKRVVAENRYAIAIAPYASKVPFEVRILPKAHHSHFYKTPPAVVDGVALLLQSVMRQLRDRVNDPDLNFFIHEAPLDGKNYPYHHWHVEVLPRISIPAGVEFSTGVYVNVVDPASAAAILRGEQKAKGHYH